MDVIDDRDADLCLLVSDTGPGVSPELLPYIFDRFSKSADSGGSGLGLAIARRLVQAQGGQIGVESRPGGGATFWFTARFGIAPPSDTELTQRKLEQGSQQTQGEAQEVVLKQLLAQAFPADDIEDVPQGVTGADLLQRVRDAERDLIFNEYKDKKGQLIRGIVLKGNGLAELWHQALALGVFAIAFFTFATRRFSKTLE